MSRVRVDNPNTRTTRTLDWFVERVRLWQERLGLQAWTIHVELFERAPRMVEGQTKVFPTVTEANVKFKANQYESWGDKVVVHELVHIMTDEWSTAVAHVVRTMVPSQLQAEAREYLLPHEEQIVDNIAKALQNIVEDGVPVMVLEVPNVPKI